MDDFNEDVSARILIKHVLHTEPPLSPVTRRASHALVQSTGSGVRRSVRLRSDVMPLTPQGALKQSLRKKLHENTYRASLPMSPRPSKKRTMSEAFSRIKTPATNSFLDDDPTPRHLLRGILQTVPETSLLIQERRGKNEPELPSANSSLHSNEPSTGLSDLDLPDLTTTVSLVNTVKGLKRKRPRRSFNVRDFNMQLERGEDAVGESSSLTEDLSSLCASPRSITLSLKTPFVDARTEKKKFLRKAPNRKKLTIEQFEEGLQNVQAVVRGDPELSDMEYQQAHGETVRSQGFTLGLSDIGPDLTLDIINNRTALYALPAETTSTSNIDTQDKHAITGTQIQQETGGTKDREKIYINEVGERSEEEMELDNEDVVELMKDAGQKLDSLRQEASESQNEDEHVAESLTDYVGQHQNGEKFALTSTEDESQTVGDDIAGSHTKKEDVAESQTEDVAESQTEDVAESQTEDVAESQTEDVAESQTEDVAESQTEDVAESQTEDVAESQSEDDVAESQSEEDVAESQTGEDVAESQTGEDVAESQTEEDVAESQTEEDVAESQTEDVAESQSKDDVAESQSKDDVAESQSEDDVAESQTEDVAESQIEDVAESQIEDVAESQSEDDVAESQSEDDVAESQSEDVAESQSEDVAESQSEQDAAGAQAEEDVAESRTEEDVAESRTGSAGRRSEGDTAGEWHSGPEVGASESVCPHTGRIGSSPPSLQEENSGPYTSTTSQHPNPGQSPAESQSPADRQDDWEDLEEEDDDHSEELSMKTPAFVREKRNAMPANPLSTPTVLKDMQPRVLVSAAAMKKPKVVRRKQAGSAKDLGLPKSYVMGIFKHFAKTKVSTDVYPVLKEILERYFDRLVEDLETYADHANRKTIEVEDVELLMRRQGFVTDSMPVNVLIEKYLPMESRKLLIPIATSGNFVIPKPRRK
ncbi:hypothetical protein UPYG_G00084670 [Umbra pygmaea]|uniref:CENP-T/Histone H4 histone fold domain-containing protein n=1 Tax=Umbra pygmaea TaxID=75934 RepID=A0ABD0XEG6_UMBPY